MRHKHWRSTPVPNNIRAGVWILCLCQAHLRSVICWFLLIRLPVQSMGKLHGTRRVAIIAAETQDVARAAAASVMAADPANGSISVATRSGK